ncbi:hypothetical protein PHYPSEUDO_011461 [Phytophthora pseudosyringae]|uniref:Uncharacterized protein n=1 Tax=Phytophthora pseudosyringae TaxID=221518 RepID=A0A8T1W8F3_9STRA|nr:hypothetical protein PHYPSEUDO_011461 [Phytophthora pseudosyringae]
MTMKKGMSVKDVVLDMVKDEKCGYTLSDVDPQPVPTDGKAKWRGNEGAASRTRAHAKFTSMTSCQLRAAIWQRTVNLVRRTIVNSQQDADYASLGGEPGKGQLSASSSGQQSTQAPSTQKESTQPPSGQQQWTQAPSTQAPATEQRSSVNFTTFN